MKPKHQDVFCEKCGAKCVETEENASKWSERNPNPHSIESLFVPYPAHDIKTGKENIMSVFECPNRTKMGWFNLVVNKDHTRVGRPKNFISTRFT